MEVYHVLEDDLERVPETSVDFEQTLEKQLVRTHAATIGGEELLYVSRQKDPSGDQTTFDLIAVDVHGDIVILELKRDRTPRDIIAQALDYASGLRNTSYDTLAEWYEGFRETHDISTPATDILQEAHAEYFGLEEPLSEREFNQEQRLLLLADEFDEKTISVADFLREHSIDVICVTHQSFQSDEGVHLLTTEAIRRPLHEEPQSLGEENGSSGARTADGEKQLAFWEAVQEEIATRNSPLNNRWTPRNITSKNLKKVASDVPIQGGCKITKRTIEMRLIIRDDADLYKRLKSDQARIEEQIREQYDDSLAVNHTTEWVPPGETNTPKNRCKFIIRRSVDFDSEQGITEGARWLVEAGVTFFEVFSNVVGAEET